MRKMMKKMLLFLMPITMFAGVSEIAYAEEDNIVAQSEEDNIVVEINEQNFPDPVFRDHILNGFHYIWDENNNQIKIVYDANKDGKLSESEIANIQQMLLQEKKIYDLTGIEYFTSLIELDCQWTQISSLDVSKNTELQYLNCYRTNLAGTLDLSANVNLKGVCCSKNSLLENVIVNNCTELENLDVESTGVSSINLSGNSKLKAFSCSATPISALDLSHNPELESLSCYNTLITTLDVSHNPMLTYLKCSSNSLESIDLSKNTNLNYLDISNTKIQGIDVSNHDSLLSLMVTGNSFVWLNIGDDANMFLYTSEGMAELTVPEKGFDITEYFSGIETEKITIVSGGKLEGNIISGYEEGTPLVYNYNCGKLNGEDVVLTATLNLSVKEEESSKVPDDEESSTISDEDHEDGQTEESKDGTKETSVNDGEKIKESVPDTGDDANVMALLVVMVIGAVIMVGVTRKRIN